MQNPPVNGDGLHMTLASVESLIKEQALVLQEIKRELAYPSPTKWLSPKEFGKLIGKTPDHIGRLAKQGAFSSESIREKKTKSGIRRHYHASNAVKDFEAYKLNCGGSL